MGHTVQLGNRLVGNDQPAYVIAEAGANHNGDLSLAFELIAAAKEAGCDCVKFQTFSAEEFCADKEKTFTYQSQGKEVTESEFEMFKRFEFTADEWAQIIQECEKKDIFFMTTVQDMVNLELMQTLGLEAIKVGSDDFDHILNLKKFAETGLPLIISKGMANLAEVDHTLSALKDHWSQIIALHCVSIYPAGPAFLNLNQIPLLKKIYPEIIWGFSDHSQGTLASTLAVTMGARVIEKHFTMDHSLAGPDHWFSMDPQEMSQLVRDIRFAEAAMGSNYITPSDEELKSKKIMRRRIVAKINLEPGTVLSEKNVGFKRADKGSFLGEWTNIEGSILKVSKRANEGISLSDVNFS
ncbi:N-acetylneuraminate synthase family protein [Terasakiella sp. SH-1]|uniref:N-acetylneuraminate synthase family protein n=1 Tax=Terasakiella sp. SH-1 TaxID=2560057 RepID=UPI001073E1DF|nr:N-acetylneuraminate synthase family protein [Terasakiella sp. SH-1]